MSSPRFNMASKVFVLNNLAGNVNHKSRNTLRVLQLWCSTCLVNNDNYHLRAVVPTARRQGVVESGFSVDPLGGTRKESTKWIQNGTTNIQCLQDQHSISVLSGISTTQRIVRVDQFRRHWRRKSNLMGSPLEIKTNVPPNQALKLTKWAWCKIHGG